MHSLFVDGLIIFWRNSIRLRHLCGNARNLRTDCFSVIITYILQIIFQYHKFMYLGILKRWILLWFFILCFSSNVNSVTKCPTLYKKGIQLCLNGFLDIFSLPFCVSVEANKRDPSYYDDGDSRFTHRQAFPEE